jgi:carboxylesterase type B
MRIDWTTLLGTLGSSAFAIGALAWLARTLVLNRLAKENQQAAVRFSKLHEKRADVLAVLYRHLSNIDMLFSSLPTKEQEVHASDYQRKADRMLEEMTQAAIYFRNHALYFDPALKDKLDKYFMGTLVFHGMTSVINETIEGVARMPEDQKEQMRAALLSGMTDAAQQIRPLLADVERDFRKLLEG